MDNSGGGFTPEFVFRATGTGAVRCTPASVFRDFRARQKGLIKAFTRDLDSLYLKCDPEKENLCLYGFPNETWGVDLPVEEVPPHLPEPALGINFARDAMNDKDWLSFVAAHSDSWLLSVAFYYGARFGFDQESRKRLFNMINSVPTIFEVVTGADKGQPKERTQKNNSKSNKSASKLARQLEPNPKSSEIALPEDKEASDGEEEEPRQHSASCGRMRNHESTLYHAGSGIMRAAGPGAVRYTCAAEFVFQDFRARQQGLLKAFTTEVDRFYPMCGPEKKNLCLYGLANETWEVDLPVEELPSVLPEPALGINFARDGMNYKDWLSLVAAHSDSWLLSVAFYNGARFGLDQESRTRLFSMINSVPTTF